MLALVRMAVETELRKRKKLEDVNTVDDVVNLIKKSSNIVILAGAGSPPSLSLAPIFPLAGCLSGLFLYLGISTSCGIPDFRSDTGIYSMLADYGLDDPHVLAPYP
jgi:hypothetical protein